MSISDLCRTYQSARSNGSWDNWKRDIYQIATELERENHPNYKEFHTVAIGLMMNDIPGYGPWLNKAIAALIVDSKAQLDPLPDLPDYDEMSSKDLVDKYEMNDTNYSREDILMELRQRYPSLIQSDQMEYNFNLREILKDVI